MNEIIKSIVLGVLTVAVWLVASVVMNDTKDTDKAKDKSSKEHITFVETLTIDYEGDTNKI